MRSAAIQALDQVAVVSSRAAACSGEASRLSSSQGSGSPRISSQFRQGGIHRLGNRHRSVGDRLVSHAANMSQA